MNTPISPRWPFRLALLAPIIFLLGSGVTLIGVTALKREYLWRVMPWQTVIVGATFAATALLALVALSAAVRSLFRYPACRTRWNYGCLSLTALSLILVTGLAAAWAFVMSALSIVAYEGGWAAFGDRPRTTMIVGTVSTPAGPIRSQPFVDNLGNVRTMSITRANGCFYAEGPEAIDFGTFTPGFQDIKVPIGKGFFLATVSLNPLGAPEPSKVTLRRIPSVQFIIGKDDCVRIGV
jgi:hypothetical protein